MSQQGGIRRYRCEVDSTPESIIGMAPQEQDLEKALAARLHYGAEAMRHKEMLAEIRARGLREAALARTLAGADPYKQEIAATKDIRVGLDPEGPRAGNLGNYAKRVAVLGDLDRLLKQYPDPTASQWQEIATAFDSAISSE